MQRSLSAKSPVSERQFFAYSVHLSSPFYPQGSLTFIASHPRYPICWENCGKLRFIQDHLTELLFHHRIVSPLSRLQAGKKKKNPWTPENSKFIQLPIARSDHVLLARYRISGFDSGKWDHYELHMTPTFFGTVRYLRLT